MPFRPQLSIKYIRYQKKDFLSESGLITVVVHSLTDIFDINKQTAFEVRVSRFASCA
jgi:anti-sigma regulatory factor (Ser/Thr protein kinase)